MGIVGGSREYDGPGLGVGPWACPACTAENTGPLDAGCTSCGSGSARAFRPQPAGSPQIATPPRTSTARIRDPITAVVSTAASADLFERWWELNQTTLIRLPLPEVARLAWEAATTTHEARTMLAPPVTADTETYAPEGKGRRTMIAALELFKDQVLRDAQDEIASGEWCSVEEIEQLITELKQEEGSL
jgi:hypothetical protein